MVRIFVLPTNYPWVGAMGEAPGAHKHKFLPIIRSGNGKFLGFGEPKAPDADKMKGRFAQLLPTKVPDGEMRQLAKTMLEIKGVVPAKPGTTPCLPRSRR